MKKTVAVFTSSRADYGLLRPLLQEINRQSAFHVRLLVSGAHLSPEFGYTYREIEKDGFRIDAKIETLLSGDTETSTAKSLGLGVGAYADVLARFRPDALVVLGDRFETLACAIAAHLLRIPIAHLHGGELTEGVADDAWRHAITKMSTWHFTSTKEYRRRVIQLGEAPRRVFCVGALGLDNIRQLSRWTKRRLETNLGIAFSAVNLLVTVHPVPGAEEDLLKHLFAALDSFPNAKAFFTFANADPGARGLQKEVAAYVAQHPTRAVMFDSLGAERYLSLIACSDAVVGNSSSGIIEAPSLGVPTVNIGARQTRRARARSVVDCSVGTAAIRAAIQKALSPAFQRVCARRENVYGDGRAAPRIVRALKIHLAKGRLVSKTFHDVSFRERGNKG